MKGDFSKLRFAKSDNFTGVLHQQGRVLLDQDWNAQQSIVSRLRETFGQDVIGAGVAAVPAGAAGGFRVTQAKASSTGVKIKLSEGRVWIDGLHLTLGQPVELTAEYFSAPVQDPESNPGSIASGVRDAVVLEAWEEEVSAFQDPANLIEPALGGPDTTERINLYFALRLFRLAGEEDCRSIGQQLRAHSTGKLTVTAGPVVTIGGDCPVETGGGYTGLEHYLYRVEIADPHSDGSAQFKWSRFNGGLVGRGSINSAADEVTITGNSQMINCCGLTEFYLEAFAKPAPYRPWTAAFTAAATLSSDGVLSLSNTKGTWPAPAGKGVFIRLWDGIDKMGDFASTAELENGIQLEFSSAESKYQAGDYWTFPVRAAGVDFDPSVWPQDDVPHGVRYHRAPIAEIHWSSAPPLTVTAPADIEDCRDVFPSLTNLNVCCTYSVGDGVSTHGDFDSIQEAVDQLPKAGGRICLLPGVHKANAKIHKRKNITIHGCDGQTIVIPRPAAQAQPIFNIMDSSAVTLAHMKMVTFGGTAIEILGTEPNSVRQIEVDHNRIVASRYGVAVGNGLQIGIRHNHIRMIDKQNVFEAVLLHADDAWIERNDIGVIPANSKPPGDGPGELPQPEDPCADPEAYYGKPSLIAKYLDFVFIPISLLKPLAPYKALGGIRVAGGSERVRILENGITGGAGNGITLGGVFAESPSVPAEDVSVAIKVRGKSIAGVVQDEGGSAVEGITLVFKRDASGAEQSVTTDEAGTFVLQQNVSSGKYLVRADDPEYEIETVARQETAAGVDVFLVTVRTAKGSESVIGGGFISEVLIERNEIQSMGLSGIGVTTASGGQRSLLASVLGDIVFDLEISHNWITCCFRNPLDQKLLGLVQIVGVGGISLGICDDVLIDSNHIENNGLNHTVPAAGIFAALADHIEIRDNYIAENGKYDARTTQTVREGIRGGIALRAMAGLLRAEPDDSTMGLSSQPAARVYGNVVRQPIGQSLTIFAFGPVAVDNNFLSTDQAGPQAYEILAGVVGILNLAKSTTATTNLASTSRLLIDGRTLYGNNQVRLGPQAKSLSGQAILVADDLGYSDNQSDCHGNGVQQAQNEYFFTNSLLMGSSVRAVGSRFRETSLQQNLTITSLFTLGQKFNNTSNNQGDHCIFAFNVGPTTAAIPLVDSPNQVLEDFEGRCTDMKKPAEEAGQTGTLKLRT